MRVLNGNADDMLRYLRTGDVDFVVGLLRNPTPYEPANDDWVIGTPGANHAAPDDRPSLCSRSPGTTYPRQPGSAHGQLTLYPRPSRQVRSARR